MEYIIMQAGSMSNTIYSKEHKDLVTKLRNARKESGLTQIEVAKLLGRSQSYVSKMEKGQRRINVTQLKEFAKIYGRKIDYFIND